MGVVHVAEQSHPVRLKVALKVIKPGMNTKQVVARFEAERQALAMMDHPNISKVHDGGTTDSGRPYFVMELVPGGPAAASNELKAGDKIVGVSQGPGKEVVDLVDLPLPQAVELIRGPKGTDVTLTIIPAGATDDVRKTITIQHDEIHLESQEAKARIVDFPTKDAQTMRLGVIDLPAFYANEDGKGQSATADVAQLVNKLEEQNVRGIILDLRRNGGGSLAEAISLTGLFIPSGPVVQTRDLAGRVKVDSADNGPRLYTCPLIVRPARFITSPSRSLAAARTACGAAPVGRRRPAGPRLRLDACPAGRVGPVQRAGLGRRRTGADPVPARPAQGGRESCRGHTRSGRAKTDNRPPPDDDAEGGAQPCCSGPHPTPDPTGPA